MLLTVFFSVHADPRRDKLQAGARTTSATFVRPMCCVCIK